MKPALACAFLISALTAHSSAQTTIYNADFTTDGDGFPDHTSSSAPAAAPASANGGSATSPEGRWMVSYTAAPSTDSSANSFSVNSGAIEIVDWGDEPAKWESFTIDVSGFDTVDIAAVGETLDDNVQNAGAEFFEYFYTLDGGSEITTDVSLSGDTEGTAVNYSVSTLDVSSVSTLTVGFNFEVNGQSDGYSISSFTVAGSTGGPDTTAPTLSSTTPGNGTSNIAIDTTLTLTFDETVQAGTGSIELYNGGGLVESFNVASEAVFGGTDVTVTPSSELSLNTSYYVLVDNGAITDTATSPNVFTGITMTDVFAFTTTPNKTPGPGDIVITEIMQNPDAVSDSSGEWFELHNPTAVPVNLEACSFNNAADTKSHTINNGGPLVIAPGAYLLLANNDDNTTNGGLPAVDYEYSSFSLGNTSDQIILKNPSGVEIDRVEWDNGATFPDPEGASMSLGNPASDNNVGSNWTTATDAYGDGDFGTPGAANPTINTFALALNNTTVSESAGFSATTLTITRSDTNGALTDVTITVDDPTEAVPQVATISIADADADETVDLDAIDDLWVDGDQTVTITVSAAGYESNTITLTVQDAPDFNTLVINEVYYAPDSGLLDANNDGTADANDEFIEIVNISASPYDLSFCTIVENGFDFGVRGPVHTFPFGTVLAPGASIVIFSGGDITPGTTTDFGTAEVQLASSGDLHLTDAGEHVRLRDSFGAELYGVILPDASGASSTDSITLSPDLATGSPYVAHSTTPSATDFSPGTQTDGTNFVTVSGALTVVVNSTIVENDGFIAGGITVSLPSNVLEDTEIQLFSSDATELTLPPAATIPGGQSSVNIDIFPMDDNDVDGNQTVTITAVASGYLNGTTNATVEDDGNDIPTFTDLVINEVDCDTPGTDEAEFVELYNKTGSVQSLDGLVLVFYNGSDDQSDGSPVDLSGHTIPANGFFVIGNSAVTQADITVADGALGNGPDAVALYDGLTSDYPNNTPVATTDGVLVDAVVYDTNDADDSVLINALTPGQPQVNESGNGDSPNESIARATDGGAAFDTALYVAQAPTPGATNVIAVANFSSWATDNGVLGGPTGDEEPDGISNLIEYALGLDPNVANSLSNTFDGSTLSFSKGAEAVSNGDLTYSIETSSDLGATDPWTAVTPDVNDSGTISYTLPTGQGTIFGRLVVTQNP